MDAGCGYTSHSSGRTRIARIIEAAVSAAIPIFRRRHACRYRPLAQTPLFPGHFLTAFDRPCHPERMRGISQLTNRFNSLTRFLRTDTFVLGKELIGENRGVDRILRRLKLHAEGRQFGDQNS